MTDRELADKAENHLRATTISYPDWKRRVSQGQYTPKDGSTTQWGMAFGALEQIGVIVEPPPPDPTDPPPPPTGNVLELSGTLTAADFLTKINAAPAGALTVRPKAGSETFTVTGLIKLSRQKVTIQKATLTGVLDFDGAHGLTVEDSTMFGFECTTGANDWTLQRNLIDCKAQKAQNYIYRCRNWKILNNRLQNFHYAPNESEHSEALYIGAGNDGFRVADNYFYDNGTTGHIFFTWWPSTADNVADYPKNGCVTGNTFEKVHNKYHCIDMRNETAFQAIRTIHIDPNTNINKDADRELADANSWLTPCP